MKKKIIVLGIIILLIGIIAPQSGAVQELDEQQNSLQAPLEEETYEYALGSIMLSESMQELAFESKNSITIGLLYEIYFNVKITGTIIYYWCSEIGPIFLYKLRKVDFEEGDHITIECPIFFRVLDIGPSALPSEEQEINGLGFSVTATVVR
jgi:hypothetical protein